MEIVAVDLGGTHVRFALAKVEGGRVVSIGDPVTYRTGEFASFVTAWDAFKASNSGTLPRALAMAVAGPVHSDGPLKLTNNPWVIVPAALPEKLGLDHFTIVNDFEAVAHAVTQLQEKDLLHIGGPEMSISACQMTSVLGPGTGLGVAAILRRDKKYFVIPTEGGHIDFAPLDEFEDKLLAKLRRSHRRVSVERIVAGPGLIDLYQGLAEIEGRPAPIGDGQALWSAALQGEDALATAALDRFCLSLGSVAGDIALAQGAGAVVIGGGLGLRLARHLPNSGFLQRLIAKGRFETMMRQIPVKLIIHPQAGLFGVAVAFAQSLEPV